MFHPLEIRLVPDGHGEAPSAPAGRKHDDEIPF